MANPLLSRCTCLILRTTTPLRQASSAAARAPPLAATRNSDRSNITSTPSDSPRPTPPRPARPVQDRPASHRYDQETPRRTPIKSQYSSQSTSYPSSGSANAPQSTSARPGKSLDESANEGRRREELYRTNNQKALGGEKVYALQRERARGENAFAQRGDGIRMERNQTRFGEGTSNYSAGNRPQTQPNRSSYSETRFDSPPPPRRTTTNHSAPRDVPALSTPSKFTNNKISSQSDSRAAPKDRHATAQRQKNDDRNRRDQTFTPKLVPGQFNKALYVPGAAKKAVLPIVRGGRVQEEGRGRGMGGKRKRAEMQKVVLPDTIRLENLTNILGVPLYVLQKSMERIGLTNTRAERVLNAEDASLLALDLNFDPIIDDESAFDIYPSAPHPNPATLSLRPPVTGIFGHVDHGKTSLLDALRSTTVAEGEAGGITQHIGAFEVGVQSMVRNLRAREGISVESVGKEEVSSDSTITFLDTPGHAAFAAMRQRGAGVTDVVVLVVAADDGVKPQTEEVIRLIKASEVGVVVALTKVDKPGVDTSKVKQSLMAAGIEVESFGGDIPCVEVSSVTGQGLPELLETISAIAEVMELKAEREGRVEGRVIESRVEIGRGNVATVLVLRGCLRPTASLVAGTTWCRVRQLTPFSGSSTLAAYPGQPVEVTGWKELPSAGDQVLEANSEDEAKKAVANRVKRIEMEKMWKDVEVINEKRVTDSAIDVVRKEEEKKAKAKGLKGNAITAAGNLAVDAMEGATTGSKVKELVLIIKADVSGTVEAVVGALEGIGNKEAKVKIIFSGVGDVQESDVEMAKAVEATIVGFNVKVSRSLLQAAARPPFAVPIHVSPIIYRLVETIRQSVADLLPKITETRVHGEATIQQVFEITVKGRKEVMKVAGCKVGNGVFQKGRKARVMRNGVAIHTGIVDTLKQAKKDVLEITKGTECGIALEDFNDYEVDDTIQSIEEYDVPRTL